MPLGFRQLPVAWWPASRLYYIDYATPDDARTLNPWTPLRVALARKGQKTRNKITGEEFIDNPNLAIKNVSDREGRGVAPARLRLSLRTLDQQQGYWLDTGILLGT
jgi:hypothetical protein